MTIRARPPDPGPLRAMRAASTLPHVPASPHVLALLPLAATLVGFAVAVPGVATAQATDVAAIQAREARNADARTLAALERFRQALSARFGGDPMLTMIEFGESEATALVLKSPASPPEFVIWRGDRWIGTENRKLDPWAGPDVAAANAFAISSLRAPSFRAWQDAWRRIPGQATDFVMKYAMAYDPAAGRVVVRATVGSMTTGRIAEQRFDPASGAPVTVAAAAPPPAPKAAPRRSADLRRDVGIAITALRREVPATPMGAVRVTAREIAFTLADRSTWRFDATHTLTPGPRYDGIFLCEQGWAEADVDWGTIEVLPRNGVLAAGLGDDAEQHARIVIDRPRDCGGLVIEVFYDNYRAPQPWVRFDPRGRLLRSSQ